MLCKRMGKQEDMTGHWLRREHDAKLCCPDEPVDHHLLGWNFKASIACGPESPRRHQLCSQVMLTFDNESTIADFTSSHAKKVLTQDAISPLGLDIHHL